ncbi:MAG: hypothetical protein ACOYBR_09715 [Fluviibacter sp.]
MSAIRGYTLAQIRMFLAAINAEQMLGAQVDATAGAFARQMSAGLNASGEWGM